MSLLSLERVTKRDRDGRRSFAVLDEVSIEIEAGDFIGLWGPRRSGKSTLLRILAGMEAPDSGVVRFDGHALSELSAVRRAELLRSEGIALVKPAGDTSTNRIAVEEVLLPLLPAGWSRRQAAPRARRMLQELGVAECADMRLSQLTLSERIRVALAGALIREPRVLLVDEPAVLSSLREAIDLQMLLRLLGDRREGALIVASEELDPLQGARRMCSISQGELRFMDSGGVVLPFPEPRPGRGSRAS